MEWHPYAASFPMLSGEDWEAFKASIEATGGNTDHPILYRMVGTQKQGLDGRNRERACTELHIKPTYKKVKVKDDEVEDYIDRQNTHRRHLTIEALKLRRAARVQRVAKARTEGQSIRAIAEKEKVATSTVHADVKASGVRPRTPEVKQGKTAGADRSAPESLNGKITGKDGKSYSATREPGDDTEQIKADKAKSKSVGKVKFDWKKWDKEFGTVIRSFENLKKAYPDNPDMKKADRLLDDIAEAIKSVRSA